MKIEIGQENREFTKAQLNYRDKPLSRQVTVVEANTGKPVVTCRTYYPAGVAYCLLWVNSGTFNTQGGGSASGYGYCKESAAIDEAIWDAGIRLSESVSGRGIRAADDALLAIAKRVSNRRKFHVVTAHA